MHDRLRAGGNGRDGISTERRDGHRVIVPDGREVDGDRLHDRDRLRRRVARTRRRGPDDEQQQLQHGQEANERVLPQIHRRCLQRQSR